MFGKRSSSYYGSTQINRRSRTKLIAFGILFAVIGATIFLSITSERVTPEEIKFREEADFYKRTNEWKFAVIADMDHASKVEGDDTYWRSFLQKATLSRDPASGRYTVNWESTRAELKTVINEKGRAMELSDLVKYGEHLYACDDRTGIVYQIVEKGSKAEAIPKHILMDGDGNSPKGFKCEWGTVKDNYLYIGSFGKEFTSNKGEIINQNPMWVKIISPDNKVVHVDWSKVYLTLREATGTQHPGYLFHESAHWNPLLKRWFFLPRRVSKESYEPTLDESRGGNIMISTNESFEDVQTFSIGALDNPTRGYSCFRFIPGRKDEILAIKSEEVGTKTASYVTVFNLQGEILLEETHFIDGIKYEGLEFLDLL